MSSKKQVKARHHYKVQGSGLIILQFAALVTHDLAVHAEHVRSKLGARAERTRRTRGACAERTRRELFHAGGVSFSASVSPRNARPEPRAENFIALMLYNNNNNFI